MSVLDDFRQAIAMQQRKDDEAYEELMKLPIDERVAKGITMTNLTVEFVFHDEPRPNPYWGFLNYPQEYIKSAKITCETNISKFREGEQVILSNGSHKFKMEIIEDTIHKFIIAPNNYDGEYCFIDSENYVRNNWQINIVKTDLTSKLLNATANNLSGDPIRLRRIEQLFGGIMTNTSTSQFEYSQLNNSQNSAVSKALSMNNFHLIQGPPGTGKTKTIAHIAKALVNSGKKIFITAPTHTAINNCLNAIASEVKDASKVVKIGEKYQSAEILFNDKITRKTRLQKSSYSIDRQLSQNGIIIGGTPYCFCYPASKRLENWEFDVAIIDEAAQMSIPLAVSIMSKCDKFIFVGDHKQLDPIVPSNTGLSMFRESIFAKLARLYPTDISFLNISYRLNENLIRIPNQLFYNNQLSSDSSTIKPNPRFIGIKHDNLLNNHDPKILFLHKVFDAKGRSPHEAKIVAELVSDLLNNGVQFKEIAIISPYRAQIREIKKALNSKIGGIDTERTKALFIDTVDRMQGQERDYVIYSLANSHPLEAKVRLEFFYSPNRLNVAITRAIKKCIVISNYKVFDIIDEELMDIAEYTQLKPSLNIFKEYKRIATKIEEVQSESPW
jgi:DNA replication ATP-dependent helicase Dna2